MNEKNERFKILIATPFFPPDFGGIANHVSNISKKLAEMGHSISILAPERDNTYTISSDNFFENIYKIPSFDLPGWPYQTLKSISIPKKLGSKIELIIHNGNFDVVHVHGHHYPFSWYALKSAKKNKIPSVMTLHGMYALNPTVLGGKTSIEEIFNKIFFKKILSKCNAVIGLTPQITEYAKHYANKSVIFFTIPNGVNTEIFSKNIDKKNYYRKLYNIKTNSTVILFRGRFEHVKGIIEFCKAAKKIAKNTSIEIIIIGGGSLESDVMKIISNSENIHLHSWQPIEKIHDFYIASDIFVIPSRFEALPITIIEAMNAGLHIVFSKVGGIPEILQKYPHSTPINEVSSDELEQVLKKLISCGMEDTKPKSLQYAKTFDWTNVSVEISRVYDKIIKLR